MLPAEQSCGQCHKNADCDLICSGVTIYIVSALYCFMLLVVKIRASVSFS